MISLDSARTQFSDRDLVTAVTRLAAEGRQRSADLIALLAVVDERHLYAGAGYASLFAFCLGALRLSEDETFYRVAAARLALRFPAVLDCLRDGRVTLTAVALLRNLLTEENHEQLIAAVEGRSKREVQQIVAALAPQPDVSTMIRKVPAPGSGPETASHDRDRATSPRAPATISRNDSIAVDRVLFPTATADDADVPRPPGEADVLANTPSGGVAPPKLQPLDVAGRPSPVCPAAALRPAEIRPLAPTRYSLRLTISEETHAKLQRAHDMLARSVAPGDSGAVIDRALTLLIAQLERVRFAAKQPRPEGEPLVEREARAEHQRPKGQLQPEQQQRVLRRTHRGARPRSRARAGQAGPLQEEQVAPATGAVAGMSPAVGSSRPSSSEAAGTTEKARSRYIPAGVRREVWQRDQGRCAFVSPDGHRCRATRHLEFHHRRPFADGGAATSDNVMLICRRHNSWEAKRWFGEEVTTYRGGRDNADVGTESVPPPVLARVESCRDPGANGA